MKAHISEFCTEFSETLFPLAESLADAEHLLDDVYDETGVTMSEVFSDVRRRLEALINKVQGQEAYVLLFGPLKSGKSTLLNAISAAYVSEVTTMPAYPCMVYVKYGETPKYYVTRYSGKRDEVETPAELKEVLEQGHRTLAERVRSMEDFGEEFDPASHLPSAIRRVHVELPAEDLNESRTVLVDTPGLYSKMKFGYNRMTQEFRNSAAAAVFVVKTDNLFLEQVFTDFNDLLEQFSRVFVVVNIDSTKRDLCPDGTLVPSLESQDPDKIVEAFESLTMSAPLRCAAENGRLRLYPIDLCSAASRRLQDGAKPAEADDEEPDRFDAFLHELMEYLNSTEYQMEFMTDSLRQCESFCAEIRNTCESETVNEIRRNQAELQVRLDHIACHYGAVNRVRQIDWETHFAETIQEHSEANGNLANELSQRFEERAESTMDEWFARDDGLAALQDEGIGRAVREAVVAFRDEANTKLSNLRRFNHGGASLSESAANDLRTIDFSLTDVCVQVLEALPPVNTGDPVVRFKVDRIPVRRSWFDRLLFRTASSLRRKIFGPAEALDQPIPAGLKEKKLGPEAREVLMELAGAEFYTALSTTIEDIESRLQAYLSGFVEQTRSRLTRLERQLTKDKMDAASMLEKLRTLDIQFKDLSKVAADVSTAASSLVQQQKPAVSQLVEIDEVVRTDTPATMVQPATP